jgi:hypothetical protein
VVALFLSARRLTSPAGTTLVMLALDHGGNSALRNHRHRGATGMAETLDAFVRRQNINRMNAQLLGAPPEAVRRVLTTLLAEERARLSPPGDRAGLWPW